MIFPDNIKRLWAIHRPYLGRLMMAFFAMMVTAATEPVVPYIFQQLLDKGFATRPSFSLWLVPIAVILLFAVRGVSTFASSYLMTWVSARVLNELRWQMFSRLLHVPISFYASHTV